LTADAKSGTTRGVTPFGEWLARHAINYAAAAEALGITKAYVHLLATGKATPRMVARRGQRPLGTRIEEWTRALDPVCPVLRASWRPYMRRLNAILDAVK